MVDSIFVLCLDGFQCLLTVSVLIVLHIGMMAGFFPEMYDVIVR